MVKKKLSALKLIAVVLVIMGWAVAAVSLIGPDDEKEQMNLVNQAEALVQDKIYVRAIGLYNQALSQYSTDKNQEIEERLLAVYKQAGKITEYEELIVSRIERNTAKTEEYLEIAKKYIDGGNTRTAVSLLQAGVKNTSDQQIIDLYESVRYEHSVAATNYKTVGIYTESGIIAVQDGAKWGYVNNKGKQVLGFAYDDAVQFSGDYAPVKTEGKYVLVNRAGEWFAVDKTGLDKVKSFAGNYMAAVKDGKYALCSITFNPITDFIYDDMILGTSDAHFAKTGDGWIMIDSSGEQIGKTTYQEVLANSQGYAFGFGYATVKDEKGYFLVDASGKECGKDVRFADAKAMENGLWAVADQSGKWGFATGEGDMVVDFKFNDAKSFSGNLAAVKVGLNWGYVNRYGTVVIDTEYDDAYAFVNGTALVKKGDYYGFLTLKY